MQVEEAAEARIARVYPERVGRRYGLKAEQVLSKPLLRRLLYVTFLTHGVGVWQCHYIAEITNERTVVSNSAA